jgi:hypothetical protein
VSSVNPSILVPSIYHFGKFLHLSARCLIDSKPMVMIRNPLSQRKRTKNATRNQLMNTCW